MNGWIGSESDVVALLVELQADRQDGCFVLHGPGRGPVSFLGAGGELVLEGSETFAVTGQQRNLVDALVVAGRGMAITVIS